MQLTEYSSYNCVMKMSIITICYNDLEVRKTCESVINQSYQDFEWIVIDGGSDHETMEILNQYRSRINVFVSEKDNGRYHAMNKGIKLAKGEYLHFLNAGDYYYNEQSLNNVIELLETNDIVFGDLNFITDKKEFIKKYPDKIFYGWFPFKSLPHPASFIKKELFNKYGLYNEKYKIVSDWEKFIEFIDLKKCSYKHIPIIVSSHSYNGISSGKSNLHSAERFEVLSKYYKIPEKINFIKTPLFKAIGNFNTIIYHLSKFFKI